ncbi:MAG: RsmD family RNA methyltransferase [Spirochaetes bacterium]|nr:RsmD family RNA methyltransferase [Spirochaetota bacterium]
MGSGKFKRSAIALPKAHRHHQNATSARVKEAAFQIIRNHIDIESEWVFFDLFAGSGQMGIEALSLGAAHASFADIAPERLSEIQHALLALEVPHEAFTLVRARANKIFQEAILSADLPAVVWADPPYTYNHSPSNDPAQLIQLYKATQTEHAGGLPLFLMQVHEKSPVLAQEFLSANPEITVYRYGSNCLLVL